MTEEMRRRRRTAIRREMTERHENRGGTQGLVDEGPHSWMVQGDKRGLLGNERARADGGGETMQQGLSRGEFTAGQAANSSAACPPP